MPNTISSFLHQISAAIAKQELIKITLGNKRDKASEIKNVFIKPVLIKNTVMLSFVYRYPAKDTTKNYGRTEAISLIEKMLQSAFYNADVFTAANDFYLSVNKNDAIKYEFNSASNQFAVFSEIYYPNGWEAFIDRKKTPYCKTDYALRGLAIPAGKHTIEFVFDPASVRTGEKISRYFHLFSVLLVFLCLFMAWKKNKRKTVSDLKA